MTYDRMRLLKLTQELDGLHKREGEIVGELSKMFGGKSPAAEAQADLTKGLIGQVRKAGVPIKTQKPAAAPAVGELQGIVTKTLKGLRKPKTAIEIAAIIRAKRPLTTNASVASVLYQLAKRGAATKNDVGAFTLVEQATPAAAKPAPKAAEQVSTTERNIAPAAPAQDTAAALLAPPSPGPRIPVMTPQREEVLEDA